MTKISVYGELVTLKYLEIKTKQNKKQQQQNHKQTNKNQKAQKKPYSVERFQKQSKTQQVLCLCFHWELCY